MDLGSESDDQRLKVGTKDEMDWRSDHGSESYDQRSKVDVEDEDGWILDRRLKVGTKVDVEMGLRTRPKTLTTKDLKLARNHQKWHWKPSPVENAKIPIRGGLYLLWLL